VQAAIDDRCERRRVVLVDQETRAVRAGCAGDVAAVGGDDDPVDAAARDQGADHAIEQRARDGGAGARAAAEPRLRGAERARRHQRPRPHHARTSANASTSRASAARSARVCMIVDAGRAGIAFGGASPRSITSPRRSAP
jgi:hypothetical protein